MAVLKGGDHNVVSVNRTFCHAFGVDENLIEGKPLSAVLPWVGLGEIIRDLMSSPSGESPKEIRQLAQDGSEQSFLISAVPLLGNDKAINGEEILFVLNDITEQRQQQKRVREHFHLASVGQLVAGVAHEINNPLAAIIGLAEILQIEDLPENALEDARRIENAARRAAKIVQNLLFLARKDKPEKIYLHVWSIVERAMELKAHDFKLNNIQMTARHTKRVPRTMVDEHQLIQVVLNILTNAEQAIIAGQGGREITAVTRLLKGMIRISISNDGVGIPAENP